jgi:hypothetical protein
VLLKYRSTIKLLAAVIIPSDIDNIPLLISSGLTFTKESTTTSCWSKLVANEAIANPIPSAQFLVGPPE